MRQHATEEVRNGQLSVNGARVMEQNPIVPGALDVGKGRLLPGDYDTLGDNRAVAPALAVHPIVTKPDLMGKVVLALGK